MSVFVPVPYCFDYWSFIVWSEVREHDTSNFVLFSLKIALAIRQNLWFHVNFRIGLFVLVLWKMSDIF